MSCACQAPEMPTHPRFQADTVLQESQEAHVNVSLRIGNRLNTCCMSSNKSPESNVSAACMGPRKCGDALSSVTNALHWHIQGAPTNHDSGQGKFVDLRCQVLPRRCHDGTHVQRCGWRGGLDRHRREMTLYTACVKRERVRHGQKM